MDLMEVPSHVVERFANSPAVLKSFMRHHISGRAMGSAMVGELQHSQRLFEGIHLQQQVCPVPARACIYTKAPRLQVESIAAESAPASAIPTALTQVVDALVDQRLHGVRGANPGSTSSIVHEVIQQYSAFPVAEGTHPQARCPI